MGTELALSTLYSKELADGIASVANAFATAAVMVDETGNITLVNRAACRLFGYEDYSLVGQPIEVLVLEEQRLHHPGYRIGLVSSRAERPMGRGRPLFARHRDGREIPVEIALTPIETPEGDMVMCTVIDLTERLETERRLTEKAREAEALNVELARFAESASHDLKAPLVSISGLLSLCIDDLDEGDIAVARANLDKALAVSRESAEKLESALALARAHRERYPNERLALGELVRTIWSDIVASEECSPELLFDLQTDDTFVGARVPVTMVLSNLLSNAIRFREVRVSCRKDDNHFRVSITDNGIGVAQKDRAKLFRMFERFDARSGDGMGLALARKQVERLGGQISVNSVPGEGSEFSFTLPLSEEEVR